MSKQKIKFNIKAFYNLTKLRLTTSLWNYLFKKSGTIVMTLFITIALVSGFLAYRYLYSPDWSESKKNDYLMEAKKNEVNFNLEKFEKVIQKIEERNKNYEKTEPSNVKDIFRF